MLRKQNEKPDYIRLNKEQKCFLNLSYFTFILASSDYGREVFAISVSAIFVFIHQVHLMYLDLKTCVCVTEF